LINEVIVPTVMDALDTNMFPVAEGIVYDMIHNRHKHRCEEYLRKQQSVAIQDEQSRRKHLNSRRNDVSKEPVLFSSFVILTILIIFYNYRKE